MLIRCLLVTLVISGLAWADDIATYDRLKLEIQEQKRTLQRHHNSRDYATATRIQNEIAAISDKALQLGLDSPDIKDRTAWSYRADVMRDIGRYQDALKAIDSYMASPLLDREGTRQGWRKRYDVYKRMDDLESAEKALTQAIAYADKVNDRFYHRRDMANLKIKMGAPAQALTVTQEMVGLVSEFEAARQDKAQRDYQSTLVKIYEEIGKADEAREARRRELELSVKVAQKTLDDFEVSFPNSEAESSRR